MIQLTHAKLVPQLVTKRLMLRGLTKTDIPFIFQHFSKTEINEYSSDENVTSMEEAKELYEKYIVPTPNHFRLGIVLKAGGELVGTLGLYGIDYVNKKAVVGVDLMRQCWGKGLMTEALLELMNYGFNELNLNRIEASADPDNVRSIRLMQRCGFTKEGVIRQRFYYKNAFHDDEIYSVLKDEWKDRL